MKTVFKTITILSFLYFLFYAFIYLSNVNWDAIPPTDKYHYILGRDFLNFWVYGKALSIENAARLYETKFYNSYLRELLGSNIHRLRWSYPPSTMVLARPISYLPYLYALLVWVYGSFLIFALLLKRVSNSWEVLGIAIFSPATLWSLISGQHSFVFAVLIILFFRLVDRRPWVAGCVLGLLSFKPQLCLLFPVLLASSRNWRSFASASLTAIVLALVPVSYQGWGIWSKYLTVGVPRQFSFIFDNPQPMVRILVPTVFMDLKATLGFSTEIAFLVQGLLFLICVIAVWWIYRIPRHRIFSACAFFAAAAIATPYYVYYDLVFAGWLLVWGVESGDFTRSDCLVLLFFIFVPFIAVALGVFGLTGASLVPVIVFVYFIKRLRQDAERQLDLSWSKNL